MPVIAQYAEEKQTILSFVAAGLGIALVPASYKDMNADGVKYLALTPKKHVEGLPQRDVASGKQHSLCEIPAGDTFRQHRRTDP